MARARMTRHELKTQDEITSTLQKFTQTVIAWQKQILIGLAVLAVIVLAFVGWNIYASNRNAEAQAQLAAVISAFNDQTLKTDKERFEKTIREAEKTVNAYGSLPAGAIARYYIALSKDGLGDTPAGVKMLQEVSDGGDADLRGVAQFALAGIYSRQGDQQKAIDTLKALFDSGAYSKGAVAFELGKVYEANKQPDQAKVYYEKLITELTDSPFRQDAEGGLKRMGFPLPAPSPGPAPATAK